MGLLFFIFNYLLFVNFSSILKDNPLFLLKMINKIQIEGFRSIKSLKLDLTPINVLIGANGVGKSNFVSFFKFVNEIYERRLENYSLKKGANSLLHFGAKVTEEIYGYIEFNETNGYRFRLEPTNNNTLFVKLEEGLFNGDKGNFYSSGRRHATPFAFNQNESQLKGNYDSNGVGWFVSNYLNSFKVYHFHDTSATSEMRSTSQLTDNLYLQEDASNLSSFLYLLQENHKKHFKRIEQVIKSIAPYFDRFELIPDRINPDRINLEWREINNPDFPLNGHHFSDGTIRFIALCTLLLQPHLPQVIIIDEPELGLHPVAIHKLSGLIKKASKKCQIIISTQSVNLVSHFEPSDIVTVDRIDKGSSFNRLTNEDLGNWLEDFSLGDLWVKNLIKGQPF